jgi:stage II sporulation protein AA (anti-sigma F factor antagonist)
VEISRRYSRDTVELSIAGRLDGYWSDHLATALDEEIRHGRHHLLLDLSEVVFLSSAGIGVLVKSYNDLDSIRGSLSIWKASERVRKVIEICGLDQMLLAKEDVVPDDLHVLPSTASLVRHIEKAEASFDVYHLAAEAGLRCRIIGDATLIEGCRFSKANCYSMNFPDSSFAIGLGALGENFDECCSRFGEFIAVAGAVTYQPTDGTNVPDHLVAAGKSLSHVQVCYGIACEEMSTGPFSMLLRFQAGPGGPVSLTELLEACFEIAESQRLGIVMVAEAAGLVGASLRRSPAQAKDQPGPFEFPQVREWLSFTAERTHTRSMTLVAGVALRDEAGVMAPVVRPLNSVGSINGHFHAAAFSYHPLQNGKIDLKTTVRKLFERESVDDVLHLLSDDRVIAGAGESEFIRGACWIGPIREISEENQI